MRKNGIIKIVLAFVVLLVAVFWVLQLAGVTPFYPHFNGAWAVLIVAGLAGIALILSAFLNKSLLSFQKKIKVWAGVAALLIAVLSLVFGILDLGFARWIWPIIAVAAALAIFLGLLAAGGRKWDTGDNQKVGHETYHQRKARLDKERERKLEEERRREEGLD